jgi:hypothetical protein
MKILSFIVCEDVIRDVDSDRVTLVNVMEQLTSTSYPFFLPKLAIFIFLEKENSEQDINGNVLLKNNDSIIFNHEIVFSFTEKDRARLLLKFNGLAVTAPGELYAEFILKDQTKSTFIIPLHQKAATKISNTASVEEVAETKNAKKSSSSNE